MIKSTAAALALLTLFTGCANRATGAPGTGYGKDYTPIIDVKGVDPTRYSTDLAECRQYAGIVDADKAAMQGLIAGVLVGALVGAASSNRYRGEMANYGATVGGTSGVMAAERGATQKQERILINCMAGRGYRTLDGSAQASTTYPSPYLPGTMPTAMPAANPLQAYGAIMPSNPTAPPGMQVVPAAATGQSIQRTTNTTGAGKDLIQAERFAASQSCSQQLTPWPAAMGPGYETYSSPMCPSGQSMIIRCEYGNCREVK